MTVRPMDMLTIPQLLGGPDLTRRREYRLRPPSPAPGRLDLGRKDVEPSAWIATVHEPDIAAKADTIFKKPGYAPA